MTKPVIDKKFIVNLQGKDFVTYEGLLDLAHQKGLISIKTELIQLPTKENGNQCIMKAIAITEKGQFEGYGDADNTNVNKLISRHIIRMAETRAKARALRDLTNVGMTAIEELGGDEEDKPSKYQPNVKKTTTVDKDKQAIVDNSLATDAQLNYIDKLLTNKEYSIESLIKYIEREYQKKDLKALTRQEASKVINMLNEV